MEAIVFYLAVTILSMFLWVPTLTEKYTAMEVSIRIVLWPWLVVDILWNEVILPKVLTTYCFFRKIIIEMQGFEMTIQKGIVHVAFQDAKLAHAASVRIWKADLQKIVTWKEWRTANPIATFPESKKDEVLAVLQQAA
jgi:hypothetical protein